MEFKDEVGNAGQGGGEEAQDASLLASVATAPPRTRG